MKGLEWIFERFIWGKHPYWGCFRKWLCYPHNLSYSVQQGSRDCNERHEGKFRSHATDSAKWPAVTVTKSSFHLVAFKTWYVNSSCQAVLPILFITLGADRQQFLAWQHSDSQMSLRPHMSCQRRWFQSCKANCAQVLTIPKISSLFLYSTDFFSWSMIHSWGGRCQQEIHPSAERYQRVRVHVQEIQ